VIFIAIWPPDSLAEVMQRKPGRRLVGDKEVAIPPQKTADAQPAAPAQGGREARK